MTFQGPGAGSPSKPTSSPNQPQAPSYAQPQAPSYGQPGGPTPGQPQGPTYGQPGGLTPGQPQEPNPKGSRNVLALISLIVAIVGFIFACMPGALVVGWVLLPTAFILALVSLFLKGRGKGLGIAGLIISVVGTVVGVIVFFGVVATSFDDAFGDETAIVEEPAESGEGAGKEEAPADDPAAAEGTRENPVAIGSTITSEDWTVVINSYTPDGNPIVLADDFNDPAPAGSHYEVINYTVTYTGEDSAFVAGEVGVDVVTSAGNVIADYDTFVMLDDSMGLDELFAGASVTGSAAFVVPDGETVQIRVRPGMMADQVFVQP